MAQAKKKKRFFEVEIPIIKKETQLQAYEIEQLDKRIIKYDLTRMLRGKSMIIQLDVVVEDHKAKAYPRKTQILPYFLKRMVRKGTNYVEDSFQTETKDAKITIKPFLVTRRKVSRAVRKALRNKTKEELIEYAKRKNADEIFRDVLNNKIQKDLSTSLKKVYPLSLCEIRILEIKQRTKERVKEQEVEIEENIEEEKVISTKKSSEEKKKKEKSPKLSAEDDIIEVEDKE
jgi:ribosomal protein S3AE